MTVPDSSLASDITQRVGGWLISECSDTRVRPKEFAQWNFAVHERSAIPLIRLRVVTVPRSNCGPVTGHFAGITNDNFGQGNGSVQQTARESFLHPNTVRYRLAQIHGFTNRNPLSSEEEVDRRVAMRAYDHPRP